MPAEPNLSPIWSERCRTFLRQIGDRYFPGFQGRHCPRFGLVQDLILRGDGSRKHGTGHRGITLACSGSAACFTLDINSAALLSSDMSSYEEAGILRGFRVNCRWDDNSTAEYGFVIRTDASSTETVTRQTDTGCFHDLL